MCRSLKFFSFVLICAFFVFSACSNLFDDIETPSAVSQNQLGASDEFITLTGSVSNPQTQAGAQDSLRMALPTASYSDTRYYVTATPSDGSDSVSGNVNSTDHTFTIALSLGKVWTIKLGMQKQESTDADYETVLEGTYAFDHALEESDVSTAISIVLAPLSTGTGNIDLSINPGSYSFEVEVLSEPFSGEWAGKTPDYTNGIKIDGIKSGAYTVSIVFKNSDDVEVYSCTQVINVFQNMTTDRWISGGGLSAITSDGTFAVTDTLVQAYGRQQFYVGETSVQLCDPADTNQGSAYEPLATLGAAISRMTDSTKDYKIYIAGTQRGNFTLGTTDDAPNFAASSITLRGMTGSTRGILNGDVHNDGIGDGTVLTVTTTAPVTIMNLKITKGSSDYGGGIYMSAGTDVTLGVGTLITGNEATNLGGGVYVCGTSGTHDAKLTIQSGAEISSNQITFDSGAGAEGGLGIYAANAEITMTGGEVKNHNATHINHRGTVRVTNCIMNMSGGKITANSVKHMCANLQVCDGSEVFISGTAEISHGTVSGSSYDAHSPGIWIVGNSSVTMTGGKICNNTASTTAYGKNATGAGVVIDNGNTFIITGGEISGNTASGPNGAFGGAVFVGERATFKMGGSAYIPYGVNGVTGAGKNDVYLCEGTSNGVTYRAVITISSALTLPSGANDKIAAIVPANPSNGLTVLERGSGVSVGDFATACSKITVANSNCSVGADGNLTEGVVVSAATASAAISSMSGANNDVVVVGSVTSSDMATIKSAINTAYSTSSSTRVSLDLSGTTGLTECPSFSDCYGLAEIILPEGITSIPSSVFWGCSNLTQISIPSSVTSIEGTAFYRCPADIDLAEGSSNFTKTGNAIYSADGKKLVAYCNKRAANSSFTVPAAVEEICAYAFCSSNIKNITFESSSTLTTIGDDAFEFCKSLIGIVIPNSVTTIGQDAFCYCSNLASVSLPTSLTVVPRGLFEYGNKIKNLVIPDNVTEIENDAFWGYNELEAITIPASLTTVGKTAFGGCTGLKTVNYSGTKEQRAGMTINTQSSSSYSNNTFIYADWIYWLPAGTNGSAGTNGTYMMFGEFPQTIKANNVNVNRNETKTAGSYTYYKGSDGAWYAEITQNRYQNGEGYVYSDGTTEVERNGEPKYFKVEPIKWRVLTTEFDHDGNSGTAGKKLLLAEDILIFYKYNETGNNAYDVSTLRSYLSGAFCNTAFSSNLQSRILTTTSPNDAESACIAGSDYVCDPTEDKVFALSQAEATSYGFNSDGSVSDSSRVRKPTDFALASGAYTGQFTNESNGGKWWLRSPAQYNTTKQLVTGTGSMTVDHGWEVGVGAGIVPAISLDN